MKLKQFISAVLIMMMFFNILPLFAQRLLQERLQKRFASTKSNSANGAQKYNIAGLNVAVWQSSIAGKRIPLVIFSHGYHGSNTQSVFLMQAMAKAGYLVMAPNHKDALGSGSVLAKPEQPFRTPQKWSDATFRDRGDDIVRLITALHKDLKWNAQIDWSKIALAGHSLGGYTVLALSGAWPSWKLPGVKAVLALSPYCQPFTCNGNLGGIGIPVMYQRGTRDLGITPTVKNLHGALNKTSSPAYFVEFDKMGHLGWTNFNNNQVQKDLINYYCLAFLDKYVKGDTKTNLSVKLSGVSDLEAK